MEGWNDGSAHHFQQFGLNVKKSSVISRAFRIEVVDEYCKVEEVSPVCA